MASDQKTNGHSCRRRVRGQFAGRTRLLVLTVEGSSERPRGRTYPGVGQTTTEELPNYERITAKRRVADGPRLGGEAQRGARELNEPERRAATGQGFLRVRASRPGRPGKGSRGADGARTRM